MLEPLHEGAAIQADADSGSYFKYMAEFVGFMPKDAEIIRQSKPYVEKHVPEIVDKFYAHLLRYPPTRKFFLKKDGSIDQPYLELRMRHQANFWLRTADAVFDEEYARYIDYVGRAHTSRGADPHIYIAERYVIGQVGFMSHAISEALTKELRHVDEDFEMQAVEAWNKVMMIILELLARAYGHEREAEAFDPLIQVDQTTDDLVQKLSDDAFHLEHDKGQVIPRKDVPVAHVEDVPEGERKIVNVDGLSIGVFHHKGNWYAVHNSCLHRGGPVATGRLEGDTLTCPWHGFQYNVTTGRLLVDPSACLDTYPVVVEDGEIHLQVPDVSTVAVPANIPSSAASDSGAAQSAAPVDGASLKENEFRASDLQPGQIKLMQVDGQGAAVYNVGGTFFATSDECTHKRGPLSEGDLDGFVVTCPFHGSRFDVRDGKVVRGPADKPVPVYKVIVDKDIVRVEKNA
jgi:nitrite reductase/ring-hydroxylating ferredoxin subunit/hemoglobin-like flavoprotein